MTDPRRNLRRLSILVGLILLAGYALFEARRYIQGPVIQITEPKAGEVVTGPAVYVVGFGRNLSYLYINGAQAYLNEKGELSFTYTPPRGYTVLTAEAKDRFGRSKIIYIPFVVK